jgi:hypothetical protein
MEDNSELVAYLLIKMKNGDEYHLYHSWHEVEINERGIIFNPNAIGKEFNWKNVESIKIVNRLEIQNHNNKILMEQLFNKKPGER